jgi:hypothetical protein
MAQPARGRSRHQSDTIQGGSPRRPHTEDGPHSGGQAVPYQPHHTGQPTSPTRKNPICGLAYLQEGPEEGENFGHHHVRSPRGRERGYRLRGQMADRGASQGGTSTAGG